MKKTFINLLLLVFLVISNSCQKEEIPEIIDNNWDNETTVFYQRKDDFFPDRESYIHNGYPDLLKKLQADPSVLKNMETMELLQVCMSFPYLYNFSAHNYAVSGFLYSVSLFNGFEELKSRSDAIECAIKYYNSYVNYINSKLVEGDDINEILKGHGSLELQAIELLFVSGYLCDTNSLPLYPNLVSTVKKSMKLKSTEIKSHGWISLQIEQLLSDIFNLSTQTRSYTSSVGFNYPLPMGYVVELWTVNCENETSDINIGNTQLLYFPNAVIQNDATCTYNSHAYAWAPSDWKTECLIFPEYRYFLNIASDSTKHGNISAFWKSGLYKETIKDYAQVVYYPDGNHSAIVIDQNTYESKWGVGYLVRHAPTECPYISTNLKYFTKDMTAPDPDGTYPNPNPNPDPDPIPDFCYGEVHWDKSPDPTPVGTIEDFSINASYDPSKFTIDIFVSDPKDPDQPTEKPNAATIISSTHNTAQIQFNAIGTYYVCFYIYHKASGRFVGKFVSDEIYVED